MIEFTLKTTFPTSPEELYTGWLNSQNHTEMTGGDAAISDQEGASFTAWNGYISGQNIRLEPFKKIVQSWRTTEFTDDEADSQLEITLKPINGQTELTLSHSNLPAHGEQYRKGWEDHYFKPMKQYFETNSSN